jgi:hypothetical protein
MKSPLLGWSVFVRVLGWLGPRGLAKDVPATNAQLSAGTRALRITGMPSRAHFDLLISGQIVHFADGTRQPFMPVG